MSDYFKDFDAWNKFKKILNEFPFNLPFEEKEIWWAALGLNIGTEIDGKREDFARPVIIIRKSSNDTLLVIPLSSTNNSRAYTHIRLYYPLLGNTTYAVLNQMQTISNMRLLVKMGTVSDTEFQSLLKKVIYFITRGKQ